MALTTQQMLFLENLVYLPNNSPLKSLKDADGMTVGELLSQIDVSKLENDKDYSAMIKGSEWKRMIQEIKSDPTLAHMKIVNTHVDQAEGSGGGFSAVFVSESTGDAVVAFQGTAGREWNDNLIGGNATDTAQQKNALDWYKDVYKEYGLDQYEVTVTGHSKGGNKAKYITLLDDTVDHCVSFDGQGFSDKFMEKYEEQIAANQHKIHNHNLEYDYVNILLNDIGEKTYYSGHNVDNFAENHSPSKFLGQDEEGNLVMEICPTGQGKEMKALDEFINTMIRSIPEDQKDESFEMVGMLVQGFFSGELSFDFVKEIILDDRYRDNAAYVIAYVVKYAEAHPEMMGDIVGVLNDFGMDVALKPIEIAQFLLDHDVISKLLGGLGWLADHVPDWAINKVIDLIEEKYGIHLTREEALSFLKMVEEVGYYADSIKVEDAGEDIAIPSNVQTSDTQIHGQIKVDADAMLDCMSRLITMSQNLIEIYDAVSSTHIYTSLSVASTEYINESIEKAARKLRDEHESLDNMISVISKSVERYGQTERQNAAIV